jgi:hypothetical protein
MYIYAEALKLYEEFSNKNVLLSLITTPGKRMKE